jgi:hypothetical protein
MEGYELTAKGKEILKLLDSEYIKAWKEGCDETEAFEVAIARLVQRE